jgi:hypothetical protein
MAPIKLTDAERSFFRDLETLYEKTEDPRVLVLAEGGVKLLMKQHGVIYARMSDDAQFLIPVEAESVAAQTCEGNL